MTWQVEGIRQRRRPKKTWLDYLKDDTESLGLSQKVVEFRNKWRRIIDQLVVSSVAKDLW